MVIWGEATNDNNNATGVAQYGVFAKNIAKISEVEVGKSLADAKFLGADALDATHTFKFSDILAELEKQTAEKYRIDIPGKSDKNKVVVLHNTGDGNLRISLYSHGSLMGTMTISADQKSGNLQLFGVHTGEGEEFVASKGYVDSQSPYQKAVDAGYTGSEAEFYAALVALKEGPFLPLSGGTVTGPLAVTHQGLLIGDGDPSFWAKAIYIDDAPGTYPEIIFRQVDQDGNDTGRRITLAGIETPTGDYDAANKKYVEDSIKTAITDAMKGAY